MDSAWQLQIKQLHRRRWIVWIPLAFAFLASYFHRTAAGVVADSLMQEFAITRASEMGGLASVYFYAYAAMQLPGGILADFYGPRRTISLALLLAALGAVIFGCAESMTGLYAGRLISSLGVGLIYANIVKIHAEWFRMREFGTMTGWIVVAGSSGFLLAATPLAYVVNHYGWRSAFLLIAGYSLLVAVACWLLVRDRPSAVGLPDIAAVEAREGTGRELAAVIKCSVTGSLKTVMSNPYTWWPFLASVSVYGVYMAFLGLWGVPYFMQVYGMSRMDAANHMLIMAVGTMVGGPLVGMLSDRLGLRQSPNTLSSAFFLLLWLVLTVWNDGKPPEWVMYPLCFGIGLGVSGVNLNVACGKEVNPPHMTGVVAGVVNSGAFVGAGLLQPMFGWLLDREWQGVVEQGVRIYPQEAYQSAFWFCAAVLVVGVGITLLIKETRGVNITADWSR
ncbi:MAG: MFS transporter [Negativicutes bacterium]|nr:MFS transporter [Negativicutes bacterium]